MFNCTFCWVMVLENIPRIWKKTHICQNTVWLNVSLWLSLLHLNSEIPLPINSLLMNNIWEISKITKIKRRLSFISSSCDLLYFQFFTVFDFVSKDSTSSTDIENEIKTFHYEHAQINCIYLDFIRLKEINLAAKMWSCIKHSMFDVAKPTRQKATRCCI